jgi:glycosyltransferase involved in cell wall biosynthesis
MKPTISVVIPAYNESQHIVDTVHSIQTAFDEANIPLLEIIVSDDASTDGTGDLAKEAGATVVLSGKRNIGATRNVGAAAAKGDWVLFVDADSLVESPTITQLFQAIEEGYIGGGTGVAWSQKTKFWADCGLHLWNTISKICKAPAGSFLFTRKDIFDVVGGFNEELYASEELDLGLKLKKHGKLKILKHPIKTSPRKIHQFTRWEFFKLFFKVIVTRKGILKQRKDLDIWYERRP